MTGESMQELKAEIFGEKGPRPKLLINLAPFLIEPLLSKAISIAYAVRGHMNVSVFFRHWHGRINFLRPRKKNY